MAKISLVIAIFLTILTAVLGFMTKTKVEDLQSTLKNAKVERDATKTNLAKTTSELKKTNEDLQAATKKSEEQQGQIGTLTKDAEDAKTKATTLETEMAAKDKELTSSKEQLAEILKKFEGVKPDELVAKVQKSTDDLAKAQAEVAEKDQVIATLNNKVKSDVGQLETDKSTIKRYRDDIALNSFTGRITAVNPGWNFVVLDVGDRQGATVNTPLIVVRNGQNIGKVKITSVEPSTSIADVVPGSMARGQSVQPGDQVVFNRRGTPQGSGKPAQPGTSPGGQSANNSATLPQQ